MFVTIFIDPRVIKLRVLAEAMLCCDEHCVAERHGKSSERNKDVLPFAEIIDLIYWGLSSCGSKCCVEAVVFLKKRVTYALRALLRS